MLIFYVLFLVPFIQNSFSLIEEETDLNSLSNYETVDDLNANSEIWNTENDDVGIIILENPSPSLLESICKNSNTLVYISQEDVTIDCKAFNNGEQPVDETENIVKRSADEPELEGSGDEPEENATSINEPAPVETDTEKKESEPEAGETNTQVTYNDDEPPQEGKADGSQDTVDGIGEPQNHNSEEQDITTPESVQEITVEETPETSPEEETTPNLEDVQETTAPTPETSPSEEITPNREDVQETTATSEENQSIPVSTTEEHQISQNQEPETFNGTENSTEIIDITGDEQKEVEKPEVTGDKTPEVDPNSQVERTKIGGRTLINPRDKEEIKEPTNDEGSPPTDQSTQDTKKAGSKDTTILVVLFVAVVVVGSLAFAYNFIKKRRQQNADLERLERAPSIKRSFQNLAQKDLEPEKKPLIDDDKKEVEMVNMKKDNSTNETTVENGISETTVKT